MSRVIPIETMEEYKRAIHGFGTEDEDSVAIIDFCVGWCVSCLCITPFFVQLASEDITGKVMYYSVDFDVAPAIASRAGISALPTFIAYKNGHALESLRGDDPEPLQALVKKYQEMGQTEYSDSD